MKFFVINAGSSSIKSQLLDASRLYEPDEGVIWRGQVNFHDGGKADFISSPAGKSDAHFTIDATDAESGYRRLFEQIMQADGPLASIDEIKAVGHRVVHGGEKYYAPTIVDDQVISDLSELAKLAPNHEEANVRGIQIARKVFTQAKQIAVFDTGFHHTMPASSIVFPVPYSWFAKDKIRRYGFHGISHEYCLQQSLELLKKESRGLRIITCHIGNGGSLCAIRDGASLMTTMGYTPLDGLVMGTRCGALDPGLVIDLIATGRYTADSLSKVLNNESGLKGISGESNDMRQILELASKGNQRAALAAEIYINSLASNIAALVPRLGGLDVLVFAGGIGENSAFIRRAVCAQLDFLGCSIDETVNDNGALNGRFEHHQDISSENATVRTLVIKTNEELAIARDCLQFLK